MASVIDIKMAQGSDMIGMVLVVVMIIGNMWRLRLRTRENKVLIAMLLTCFCCCLSDLLAFFVDGGSGPYARVLVLSMNTWLYTSTSLCALSWYVFLKEHFKLEPSGNQHLCFLITAVVLAVILVLNLFFPIVFSMNEHNQYERQFGYWIFVALNYGTIVNSLVLYFRNYRKDGLIRFFPILLYIVPVVVATVVQTLFYGISLMAPSFSVAIAGAITSLQNERGFKDPLTGIFNRSFLDYVLTLYTQKGKKATGIMISLRDFEKVNEEYGHGEGDRALCKTAEILHDAVGNWGSILRYSGDEFIIVFDSQLDVHIANCLEKLRTVFDKFNRGRDSTYKLIPVVAYKKFEEEREDVDSFLDGLKACVREERRKMDG
mgnify:CR=1 FL=1